MLKHNLLIMFRSFKQNKSTFFINLIGLSTGLVCALLIYLWVNDELHVDKFNENDDQLYQVFSNHEYSSGIITEKATSFKLEENLAADLPEIKDIACYVNFGDYISLSSGNSNIRGKGIFASKDYFNIFSFPLLVGNKNNVLSHRNI